MSVQPVVRVVSRNALVFVHIRLLVFALSNLKSVHLTIMACNYVIITDFHNFALHGTVWRDASNAKST
jgi:hypothetical protein